MKKDKKENKSEKELNIKKHKMSKGELAVKIIAAIMAILMLGSICISSIYYLLYFFK